MKTVYIVGIGMNAQHLTREAVGILETAEIFFGAPRMLEACSGFDKPSNAVYKPAEVRAAIENSGKSLFAVLVSGDAGFFSGAKALCRELDGFDVRLVAGVSSVCFFCAKLKISWQDVKLCSVHGGDVNIVEHVRRNRCVFCLTGGNVREIGHRLTVCGFGGLTVHVGENLGYPDEKITAMTVSGLCMQDFEPLTVLLFENGAFDDSVRAGLPDSDFLRLDGVPMTKSEIRAVIASKLDLTPRSVCYDIGAGTGSVTVETAFRAYDGHVYAIERNSDAAALIVENLKRFHIGNVTILNACAPEAFADLPAPDAVFVGGSGGGMDEIVGALALKNPKVRIVVSAVAVESVYAAVTALEKAFGEAELVQISAARSKKAGGLNMMLAQNPVTIISGGGK